MIHFCLDIFFLLEKKILVCINFGDCKIKTIQIEDEWFVSVRHIGIALGVGSDILKGMVRHHLPQ